MERSIVKGERASIKRGQIKEIHCNFTRLRASADEARFKSSHIDDTSVRLHGPDCASSTVL